MIYVHNSVRSVYVLVLFIEKSVLLKSNENKVKPRYSTSLTYRPWKSVNNNSLLHNISIYRHCWYNATNCGEQTVLLCTVFNACFEQQQAQISTHNSR